MPLIYGEGGVEAFIRLQKGIMEQSDDHSLFAWKQGQGLQGHGLLASTPASFADSFSFAQYQWLNHASPYRMTNRGLEIQLPLTCTLYGGDYIALLGCRNLAVENSILGIYVTTIKDGRFIRVYLG